MSDKDLMIADRRITYLKETLKKTRLAAEMAREALVYTEWCESELYSRPICPFCGGYMREIDAKASDGVFGHKADCDRQAALDALDEALDELG